MKRREFIGASLAAGLFGSLLPLKATSLDKFISPLAPAAAKGKMDDDLVVVMSDLHTNVDGYQPDKLRRVVADILKMRPLPANVISLGDDAYLTGRPEEYALLKEIIAPLEKAGITLTLAMGNHDRRVNFAAAFPEHALKTKLPGRLVYIVETPKADIIVLDSLHQGDDLKTWITEGTLDDTQVKWLEKTLSEYKKPVFVSAHHPIHELGIQKILLNCPYVCGYLYGHDHRWRKDWFKLNYSNTRLIPTLCTPSTGHWGDIGYTTLRMYDDKAVSTLHQYEFFFPKPQVTPPLQWQMMTDDHQGAKCEFSFQINPVK